MTSNVKRAISSDLLLRNSFSGMSEITSKSTRLMDSAAFGHYKPLGPPARFFGDEVVVVRHSETIAEVFGDWVQLSKMDDNFYFPFDLNVPVQIPRRPNMVKSYQADPPLSEMGKITAQLIARELRERGATPNYVYCAPDLASLETASAIQKFLGSRCGKLRVEPELSTLHGSSHVFFDKNSLSELGYQLDPTYEPLRKINAPLSATQVVSNIRRAFFEVTNTEKLVLIVTDSLATRIISSVVEGSNYMISGSLENQREAATAMFPPLSSLVAFKENGPGRRTFEESDVLLRPLTSIGGSNDIVIPESTLYAK
ncbi:unnamed protein product [Caenorhabditis auriculariae]|uniref:Uncharacterized protein n=1 Tax=Caenorhabditis auriculariae TaxID=2777116 RepID=A0A8S1H380_9PELO|nr:unnamed protein product [Caenorhabditis auriculariae]